MKIRRYIAAVSILTAVFLFTQTTCVHAQEEIPQIVDMVPVSKEPGQLYAMSAVLMDGDSGRVLYEKDGTKARANASINESTDLYCGTGKCSGGMIMYRCQRKQRPSLK